LSKHEFSFALWNRPYNLALFLRENNNLETPMKPLLLVGLLALSSAAAFAQTAASSADPKPSTPAVATSTTPAPVTPAAGSNSFTMAQAQSRIEAAGYSGVSGLTKDKAGVWRGTAKKGDTSSDVSVDYQGNVLPK
jgi:hypothetical protein